MVRIAFLIIASPAVEAAAQRVPPTAPAMVQAIARIRREVERWFVLHEKR
jgi:hypothetical protein